MLRASRRDPRFDLTSDQSSMTVAESLLRASLHRCDEPALTPDDERAGSGPRAGSRVHRPEGLHQAKLIEWAEVIGYRTVTA